MTWLPFQALLQVGHELAEVNGVHVRDIPRVELERTGPGVFKRNAQVPRGSSSIFFWLTHVTPWFPPSDLSQNIFMDEMDECYSDGIGNDLYNVGPPRSLSWLITMIYGTYNYS